MGSYIEIRDVYKSFGDNVVLRGIHLNVEQGELVTLLGPSGCGKSTLLRAVAGLNSIDRGSVSIDGRDVTDVDVRKRQVGMVFQSYALFPHMNVFENVAFGLRARKMAGPEMVSRVEESLELVQLAGMGKRDVTELSGGQQQRVALARALAVHPRILLLDEPLSNLDAELRFSTRQHIAELQSRLGITAIYVTHDQEEALALAHRVAVLKDGTCHQIGTPGEILHEPATPFVRAFLERQRSAMGYK